MKHTVMGITTIMVALASLCHADSKASPRVIALNMFFKDVVQSVWNQVDKNREFIKQEPLFKIDDSSFIDSAALKANVGFQAGVKVNSTFYDPKHGSGFDLKVAMTVLPLKKPKNKEEEQLRQVGLNVDLGYETRTVVFIKFLARGTNERWCKPKEIDVLPAKEKALAKRSCHVIGELTKISSIADFYAAIEKDVELIKKNIEEVHGIKDFKSTVTLKKRGQGPNTIVELKAVYNPKSPERGTFSTTLTFSKSKLLLAFSYSFQDTPNETASMVRLAEFFADELEEVSKDKMEKAKFIEEVASVTDMAKQFIAEGKGPIAKHFEDAIKDNSPWTWRWR